jgi:diaminopimelate decarboxylase
MILDAPRTKILRPIDPAEYTPFFQYRNSRLHCEGVPLEAIAKKIGTPAYVYSRASIEAAYRRFDRAFRAVPHSICYAVKANSNLSVLRLLARLGSCFDVISGGELHRLRSIGVPGERIVFSGPGKTREEIREALRNQVLLLNVESEAELKLVAEEAALCGRPAPTSIRINPDVLAGGHAHISTGHHRHKFGLDWGVAQRLYTSNTSRWISWTGISAHIGSQILSTAPFRRTVKRMASFVRALARDGVKLSYFDVGGGLGVRYALERAPDLADYAAVLLAHVKPLGCRLLLEPGRVIVGPAGVLLTRAIYSKETQGKRFVIVDAAMNDFIRPVLYGGVHPITPVDRSNGRAISRADIVGPVCESGDYFLHDWPIEKVGSGELLAIWGTGAYGFVEASNYNSRPRPPEILVEGRHYRTIRRRESREDLIRAERI